MKDLKIGDKVKINGNNKPDRFGVIVAKSPVQAKGVCKVIPGEGCEPENPLCWWEVKLNKTDKIENCPDDLLEKIK